uniref:Uncharacterized protein n=1 Tax=Aegilops tauschii subsp. strangulata TaxID=200361 RepID=A0A452XXH7_AEGTS
MAIGLWNHKFQFSSPYVCSSAASVDLLQIYAEIDLGLPFLYGEVYLYPSL